MTKHERIRRVELLSEQLDAQHARERARVEPFTHQRSEARTRAVYELLELVIHEADRIDSTTYQWTFSAATLRAIEALLNEGGEG